MLAVSAGTSSLGAIAPEVPVFSAGLQTDVGSEFADVFGATAIALIFFSMVLVVCLVSVRIG